MLRCRGGEGEVGDVDVEVFFQQFCEHFLWCVCLPSDAGLWSVEKREPRQKPLSSHMELVHNVHTDFRDGAT
jgi:hypothetical protein